MLGTCPYDSERCYYKHEVIVQGDNSFLMEGSSETPPPGQPQNIENNLTKMVKNLVQKSGTYSIWFR